MLLTAARFYRRQLKDAPRAIDYLKSRGLSGEIAKQFGIGYAPDGWQNLAAAFPDYDAKALDRGRAREAERGGQPLRPLPRPHHVSDRRCARQRDRLRRPRARHGRAEISEFARDRRFRERPRALRPVPGAARDPRCRPRAGRRRLHGRRRAGAARRRLCRGDARHRDDRPSTCRSCCGRPTKSSSASTATRPAGAPRGARSK